MSTGLVATKCPLHNEPWIFVIVFWGWVVLNEIWHRAFCFMTYNGFPMDGALVRVLGHIIPFLVTWAEFKLELDKMLYNFMYNLCYHVAWKLDPIQLLQYNYSHNWWWVGKLRNCTKYIGWGNAYLTVPNMVYFNSCFPHFFSKLRRTPFPNVDCLFGVGEKLSFGHPKDSTPCLICSA